MPIIRPPRFDIKCKSPAAVWLRGFVFCAGQGRRLLLPQRALQHDVAEGQRVVQADFVGLAGNALWQGLLSSVESSTMWTLSATSTPFSFLVDSTCR